MNLKKNVVGIITSAENMYLLQAVSRVGDVVETMSGIKVEILNTDAEEASFVRCYYICKEI